MPEGKREIDYDHWQFFNNPRMPEALSIKIHQTQNSTN
jgi:hypothetical protein